MAMPKYTRPLEVWALKIADVVPQSDLGPTMLVPEDATQAPFPVSAEFVQKNAPFAGGYFVTYTAGYQTFMTAAQFEAIYTPTGA